jgi:hypothetical protein
LATATPNLTVQNWFETTLTSSISSTDTTIALNAVPTGTEGYLIIEPDSSTNREVIYYTSKTSGAVILPSLATGRGVDGTTAISHASGSTVRMEITSSFWKALQDGSALNAGALGSTPFANGWVTSALPAVSSVAANGNRSYNVTFASTVAATLSPGQRIRTTRTVAAPTQCTSLNGTTQFYSRASGSVAGMTFTDDFTVSAWVKMTSYANGGIASRFNGTSGWYLYITSSGQVQLGGANGGAGNVSLVQSYQSIPLNKWVHVSANLDMSAFATNTDGGATGSCITIDGINVPASVSRSGTNPTAIIQAGNLEIGSINGGTSPFPGKIAQVAIYNTKITNATILASMNQTLSGSETSLISAYSFNNSINDLNANANNLTANGSAVATNADSPFGGQADGTISSTLDYAIVTKVATTVATVQVPEGCTIPTTGGVSSADMSAWKVPYQFPAQEGKWFVETKINSDTSSYGAKTAATWFDTIFAITVPIGEWTTDTRVGVQTNGVSAVRSPEVALSTSTSSVSDPSLTALCGKSVSTDVGGQGVIREPVSLSAQTTYHLLATDGSNNTTNFYVLGSINANSQSTIKFRLAYL